MTLIRNFVFLVILYFSMSVFMSRFARAQTNGCVTDCKVLAQVSLTNNGLSHILESTLTSHFESLNQVIYDRTRFRPIVFDKSNCPEQTLKEALSSKSTDSCWGLPDLNSDHTVSGKTLLKPYKAEISNFDLKDLRLQLRTPLKCENLRCRFQISLNKLDLSANLKVNYAKPNEVFIPETKFNLKTQANPDVSLTVEAYLNPSTGQLDNLVFLNPQALALDIKANSLQMDMNFKKQYSDTAAEAQLKAKQFRLQVQESLARTKDDKYLQQQVNNLIEKMAFFTWRTDKTKKLSLRQASQIAASDLIQQYGSIEELKQKMKNIKWPNTDDDHAISDFMNNPPTELKLLPQIEEKMQSAQIGALAENAGFKNQQAFEWAFLTTHAANQSFQDNTLLNQVVLPMLLEEIGPAVMNEVNSELRNLQNYWNQVSAYPSLNLTNITRLSQLRAQLQQTQEPIKKQELQKKINQLITSMENDWVPVQTEMILNPLQKNPQLLSGVITNGSRACAQYPVRVTDSKDNDFDLRTEVGVDLFQEYMNKMTEQKKLNICVNSEEPITCKGGELLQFKTPPQITCKNGKFILDLDAEARKSILGLDLNGQLTAELTQCGNSACFKLSDGQGSLKSAFLNTFLGGFVQNAVKQAVNNSSHEPINIPKTSLKKYQTNSSNCQTQLDWIIHP